MFVRQSVPGRESVFFFIVEIQFVFLFFFIAPSLVCSLGCEGSAGG